jgi:PQQ-dependent dehydrogenase (s-GDH family)
MMKRSVLAALLLVIVTFAALAPAAEKSPPLRGSKRFARSVVVSGLADPWEVEWGPDGWLWITERSAGRVTRVHPKTGKQKAAVVIDEVRAPGGQDGLLGLTLHKDLLQGRGRDYVYVAYTYEDRAKGFDPNAAVAAPGYHYLYMKVARFTYDAATGKLNDPTEVIRGLPAGNDHNAGRIKFGPDGKLYLTIGDQGHNQLGNFCLPIEAQRLPTRAELDAGDYEAYVGKVLRINPDGSVPSDNPELAGVVSHVYSYGHRNPQGIDFAPDGTLYDSEHGPHTDDEVNVIRAGGNYGWPNVAGRQDDEHYVYARWADSRTPCEELTYDFTGVPESVPFAKESDFKQPFIEPIAPLFTSADGEFEDPNCGVHYICWPTIGPSSIEYYAAGDNGIPGWERVLFVTALKRGSLYTIPLDESGQKVSGPIVRHLQSEDRFRDTAVSPDRRTIYIAMDPSGLAEAVGGGTIAMMDHPGAIVAFTYKGEADGPIEPVRLSENKPTGLRRAGADVAEGPPPHFTAAQAEAGKAAYAANCAVCHGGNLMNGPHGTPLAGPYFEQKWSGRTVRELFEYTKKKMPPAAPGSLADQLYLNMLAYVFQVNGVEPSDKKLPADQEAQAKLAIR